MAYLPHSCKLEWGPWATEGRAAGPSLLLGHYDLADPMTSKTSLASSHGACSPWGPPVEDSQSFRNKLFSSLSNSSCTRVTTVLGKHWILGYDAPNEHLIWTVLLSPNIIKLGLCRSSPSSDSGIEEIGLKDLLMARVHCATDYLGIHHCCSDLLPTTHTASQVEFPLVSWRRR